MKKLAILFIAIFTVGLVSAQSPIFEKGDHTFNIGTGVANRGLPLEFSYTVGIVDDLFGAPGLTLGVGGYFGYSFWGPQFVLNNPNSDRGWSTLVGVRAELHYSIVDNLDFFGGPMVGFQHTYWENQVNTTNTLFVPGAYVGAKYFFAPNFGVYASAGYGIVFLSAGLTFQF